MVLTVIDLETTSVKDYPVNILEAGYIRINQDCDILGHGTLYFYKPEFNIEGATQYNGLTRSYLEQYAKDFDKNLAALYALCYRGILVGKNNIRFDDRKIVDFVTNYCKDMEPLVLSGELDIEHHYTDDFRKWYLFLW